MGITGSRNLGFLSSICSLFPIVLGSAPLSLENTLVSSWCFPGLSSQVVGRREHLSDDDASDTHNAQRSSVYPFVYNFSLLFSPLEESRFLLLFEGGQRSPLTREA